MVRVRYFASVRDAVGVDEEWVEWEREWKRLADLREALARRGGVWAETLLEPSVHCARNFALAAWNDPLEDGDEVAFFPPVTGG
ncbi:MAG: MoaD/ThiS family protein [Hydrogenophilus sp.]|nr:MoaD/ThiS family protein [Hydrogenophilus sp.]